MILCGRVRWAFSGPRSEGGQRRGVVRFELREGAGGCQRYDVGALSDDQRAVADFEKAIKVLGENSPRGQLIKEELAALRARRR